MAGEEGAGELAADVNRLGARVGARGLRRTGTHLSLVVHELCAVPARSRSERAVAPWGQRESPSALRKKARQELEAHEEEAGMLQVTGSSFGGGGSSSFLNSVGSSQILLPAVG